MDPFSLVDVFSWGMSVAGDVLFGLVEGDIRGMGFVLMLLFLLRFVLFIHVGSVF